MKRIITFLAVAALAVSASGFANDSDKVVLVETSLKPGDMAPMFALPDAQGNVVQLEELLKEGPALVFFYRGQW